MTAATERAPYGLYAAIARELGVSRQLVSLVARGRCTSARVSAALRVAHAVVRAPLGQRGGRRRIATSKEDAA